MQNPLPVPVILKEGASLPKYASEQAAGADVTAFLPEPVQIAPKAKALIPTGLFVEIPPGYEIQVRPRSGLALKEGITVLNTPGTIDSDYRGEIGIILINLSDQPFTVLPGMRIAQMILAPVLQAEFFVAEALSTSKRGSGGFGHTGIR
jgi:dUTP pyrophosphatase